MASKNQNGKNETGFLRHWSVDSRLAPRLVPSLHFFDKEDIYDTG